MERADKRVTAYLGLVEGSPAAVAVAFLGEDGVVGIYSVVTLPEYRRRGIGASMTRHAMEEARRAGAVLMSTELGLSVYRQLGYRECGRFDLWAYIPDGSPHRRRAAGHEPPAGG